MKVLMLSTNSYPPQHAQHLLTGLRQYIGTCEFYSLSSEQQKDISSFFSSFITLARFDRIVLEFPQDLIYKQSIFLRTLPFLTILNLSYPYNKRDKVYLKKNLKAMPWLRLISDDRVLIEDISEKGFDAQWIKPSFNPNFYYPRRRMATDYARCVVYDPTGEISDALEGTIPFNWVFIQGNENLMDFVSFADVFIYQPENIKESPLLMVQAMACGAAVVAPNFGNRLNIEFGWRNKINCHLTENAQQSVFEAQKLLNDDAHTKDIANQAIEDMQRFTTTAAGEALGMALAYDIKVARDYRKKIRIFGIEI